MTIHGFHGRIATWLWRTVLRSDEIERHLDRLRRGEASAAEDLIALLYPQLRALARHARAAAGRPADVGTHSLVHEVYLKLLGKAGGGWENQRHFLSVAAMAMRQVLVDAARARLATKRGGAMPEMALSDGDAAANGRAEEVLAVDQALTRLELLNPRLRKVVELRFFGELSVEETAKVLEVTPRTVNRDWLKAKMFILRELGG
jgi:RNA polymerase sigma factor (TIGR02999 family)